LYGKYYQKRSHLKKHLIMDGERFDIYKQYEIIDVAGKGAYGLVVACRDTRQPNDEGLIAVKKIEKAFEHRIFTKRTLRELKIMRLCNHENIIGCDLLQLPKSRRHFKEVYVYTELMETDLAVILKSP